MNYKNFRLTAGKSMQFPISGKVILVDSIGASSGVDITPMRANATMPTMPGRQKAFKCFIEYDAIELKADVDCTVALFLGDTDVSLGISDGLQFVVSGAVQVDNEPGVQIMNNAASRIPVDVPPTGIKINNDPASRIPIDVPPTGIKINNDAANRIPVDIGGGNVTVTANNDLRVLAHAAPAAVGVAPAALVSDTTYKRLRILNNSPSATVAIGGAAVTMANAAIILRPGDIWVEDDAPGAAWYAVADTAGADVRVMGVK